MGVQRVQSTSPVTRTFPTLTPPLQIGPGQVAEIPDTLTLPETVVVPLSTPVTAGTVTSPSSVPSPADGDISVWSASQQRWVTGSPTSFGVGPGSGTSLAPTATKTGPYTVAVGEIAMMNVAGGGTPLTLPAAPADKAQVGYRAIGATTAVPLVINRGGSDTIGTAGATTASIPLADEIAVLQYDATNTRWLAVSNVKTQASLDARYPAVAPWAASKAYTAGQIALSPYGVTVTARKNHTSGTTFNGALWNRADLRDTTLFSKDRGNAIEVPSWDAVALASRTGLSVAGGYLAASVQGTGGTGILNLPAVLTGSTELWRFHTTFRCTDASETTTTKVELLAASGVANSGQYGVSIQIVSGGYVTVTVGFAVLMNQGYRFQAGTDYCVSLCGDGTTVTLLICPVTHAGLQSSPAFQNTVQADTYTHVASNTTGSTPAPVTCFNNLSYIKITQPKTGILIGPMMFRQNSLAGSATAPGPALIRPVVGSDSTTCLIRVPRQYDGIRPIPRMLMAHANATDRLDGASANDSTANNGVVQASYVNAGIMLVYTQGDPAGTLTGNLSSDWGSYAGGLANRKAALDRQAVLFPHTGFTIGHAESMGAMTLLNMCRIYRDLFDALVLDSGATNLSYAYSSESFNTIINTAYGSTVVADVADHDPHYQFSNFAGVPGVAYGGTSDTTIHPANHSQAFVTAMQALGADWTYNSVAGGAHKDAVMRTALADATTGVLAWLTSRGLIPA